VTTCAEAASRLLMMRTAVTVGASGFATDTDTMVSPGSVTPGESGKIVTGIVASGGVKTMDGAERTTVMSASPTVAVTEAGEGAGAGVEVVLEKSWVVPTEEGNSPLSTTTCVEKKTGNAVAGGCWPSGCDSGSSTSGSGEGLESTAGADIVDSSSDDVSEVEGINTVAVFIVAGETGARGSVISGLDSAALVSSSC
jgi:hypothetical protein